MQLQICVLCTFLKKIYTKKTVAYFSMLGFYIKYIDNQFQLSAVTHRSLVYSIFDTFKDVVVSYQGVNGNHWN